ncbi:MAG: hypothetical protein P8184_14635, partial [Calditrichia bacterium]
MKREIFFPVSAEFLPMVFITALRAESRVLMDQAPGREIRRRGRMRIFQLFEKDFYILETGIGIPFSRTELSAAIRELNPALIINYGICGALNKNIPLHETYLIDKVCMEALPVIRPADDLLGQREQLKISFPVSDLLTVEQAVLSTGERDRLFRESGCSLVDMEGYPLAQISRELNIPLLILKMVSDMADESAVEEVNK